MIAEPSDGAPAHEDPKDVAPATSTDSDKARPKRFLIGDDPGEADAKTNYGERPAASGALKPTSQQAGREFQAQRERVSVDERVRVSIDLNINGVQLGDTAAQRTIEAPPVDWPASAFHAADGEPARLAFLVAIATLHGATANAVKEGAALLETKLNKRLRDEFDVQKATGPLKMKLPMAQGQMLKLFRAEVFRNPKDRMPSDRLRFVSDDDRRAVLDYAWFELSSFWGEDITAWFSELADRPKFEIRAAVGASAGILAHRDFGMMRSVLFNKWFRAKSARPLDALDAALTVAAEDSAVKPLVDSMFDKWKHSAARNHADHNDAVWAVGALSRGFWGRKHTDAVFMAQRDLMKVDDFDAYDQVVRVFATWFERGLHEAAAGPRAMVALSQSVPADANWAVRVQRDLIVFGVLSDALNSDGEGPQILNAALATPEAQAAAARMVLDLFHVKDLELVRMKVDVAARDLLCELIEEAARRKIIAEPAWTLLDAMVRYAAGKELADLRHWIGLRRQVVARRSGSDVTRLDAALAALGAG